MTTTLPPIEKRNAIQAYKKADTAGRKMLKDLYPDFKFDQEPVEWVRSWDDICEAYMTLCNREIEDPTKLPHPCAKNDFERYINGCHMVAVTVFVINNGRIVDLTDSSYAKHYIWWDYSSGFRFHASYWSVTGTYVGPRLCFFSKEHAVFAAKTLNNIFEQMLGQPSTK